jgi:hypothetical protein
MVGAGQHDRARDAWADHEHRQEFEHQLIDRKTTWLLTSQTILFAAYGVSFQSTGTTDDPSDFRRVVARAGLAIAVITLIGVAALINSKRIAWRKYSRYFTPPVTLPEPRDGRPLQWGVHTLNTIAALVPDAALPIVFIWAWLELVPL